MAIPPEYQRLAERFDVTQPPEQSDEDFMRWLDNLRRHVALVREARELGVSVQSGMTSVEIRQAICNRQLAVLQERGFVIGAEATLGGNTVEIKKIVTEEGRNPKITVHYWILHPWTNANNQGRANHRPIKEFLEKAKLAP